MPKKVPNQKAVAANAKKEAHRQEVAQKQKQEDERKISQEWEVGAKGKSKKDADAEKKAQAKAKKEEAKKLLEQEEKDLGAKKPIMKTHTRRSEKVAEKRSRMVEAAERDMEKPEEYVATNLDDALDLLAATTISGSGASSSTKEVEKHPERRVKAAYKAYEEVMLPKVKADNPSLRLTQLKEILWKMWQKAPENPFNQVVVSFNASQEEIREIVQTKKQSDADRLRIN
jgi:hypothetical protein